MAFFICILFHFYLSGAKSPPNIIFVLADDLGAADVSFNYKLINPGREPPISTPILDRFANGGTILTNYYTDNICGPSRNAILTSRWTHQLGNPFPFRGDRGSLADTYRTIAMEFQARGYTTAMFGKWGIDVADLLVDETEDGNWAESGSGRNFGPLKRGFDVFEGSLKSGLNHWDHRTITKKGMVCDHHRFDSFGRRSAPGKPGLPGNITCPTGEYTSHTTTRTAIEFLKDANRSDSPFFMQLSYAAPHTPIQAPEEYIQVPHCQKLNGWRRKTYCGMVGTIDDGLEKITNVMDELGIMENSIVVFTSDNGACPLIAGSNYPYRGGKLGTFEGGVHVPAFIYGPNFNIPSGKLHHPYTAHIDLGPTLLSLVDENMPNPIQSNFISDVDGMNLLPSLRNYPTADVRTSFLLHQNVLAPQYVYYENDLKFMYNAVQFEAQFSRLYPEPDIDFPVHSSMKTWDLILMHAIIWLLRQAIPINDVSDYAVAAAVRIFSIRNDLKNFWKWKWTVATGEVITLDGTYLPSSDFEWDWDRIRVHNLSSDISEQFDIKNDHKETVEQMLKHLKEETKTMDAQAFPHYFFFNRTVNALYILIYVLSGLILISCGCIWYCCFRWTRRKRKQE